MLNIGFIGTGYVTGPHLDSLKQIEDVKIAAFCNPHLEKARKLASEYEAHAYADYREMTAQEKLDAVYVCVPPFAHNGQEEFLAERGIPMLVEKPQGLNLATVENINRMISEKKLMNAVGYAFKYLPIVDRVRQLIKGRKVIMTRGCWSTEMPGVYWWRKRDTCGGQIIEQSTHVIDMMRFLFGEVAKVQGFGNYGAKRDRSDYDVEDSSTINLMFRNGIVGNLCSSIYSPAQGAFCHLNIICDGLICTMSIFNGKLQISDEEGNREESYGPNDQAFLIENKAFINALNTGDTGAIRSDYADAVKTLKLTFAAMDSLANGNRTVVL